MRIQHSDRIIGIFFLYLAAYLVLIFNLYRIQVINNDYYKLLGEQQYKTNVITKPARGNIVDRNGKPLAINKTSISAFITPNNVVNKEPVLAFFHKNFPQAYLRLNKNPKAHFLYIKRRLNQEEIEIISKSDLNDIFLLEEPSRYYTSNSFGSLIGVTDIDNNGIAGLELMYDNTLSDEPQTQILEKDAHSGFFYFDRSKLSKIEQNDSLTLTIDSTLQYITYQTLKESVEINNAESGAVIITDPITGEILSFVNFPDLDPNNTEEITTASLTNKAAANAYELGSVIKLFLALAGIEERIVSPDDIIDCENKQKITLNGIKFSTWKAHGEISFSDVIKFSNNIGVAKIGLKLGTKLYDHYKALGFGSKCNIMPGENPGFINPPHSWSNASPISLSFGYEMNATILQLVQAISILANDGVLAKLKLNKNLPTEKSPRKLYSSRTINLTREILQKTIEDGTAKHAQIDGYTVMGKTGTARLLTDGKYDRTRCIYTFVGLIEKDNYKRAIVTFIKEAKVANAYASTIAVPLFKKVAQQMIIHEKRQN